MNVNLLTENTIKLSLSKTDADSLGISFDRISSDRYKNGEEIKKLMSFIRREIVRETGRRGIMGFIRSLYDPRQRCLRKNFSKFGSGHIVVEAFSRPDESVLLYVSRIPDKDFKETLNSDGEAEFTNIAVPHGVLCEKADFSEENFTGKCEMASVVLETADKSAAFEAASSAFGQEPESDPEIGWEVYKNNGTYRLTARKKSVSKDDIYILSEYGEVFTDSELLAFTEEYWEKDNA